MKRIIILSICALFSYFNTALACTSFRVNAQDGSVLISRSMEFALDLKSELRTSPRGRAFTTVAPSGKPGLSWKAKYGYVFLDGLGVDVAIDGMNEAGLSYEALFFPDYAKYQDAPAKNDSQALPYINMGDWALSNFKTVDELREALAKIFLVTQKVPGQGDTVFPLHFSFYDASGKGIVVEYVDGKLNIYDNKIGIMTNSPNYDWHITNLRNYTQLRPTNPKPVTDNGITFISLGQGAGMLGLPGDITPPSRFVKMAVLLDVVAPAADAKGALNLAEHVINNVDIPLGLARDPSSATASKELTQWVVFKDLTNKVLYYRTYGDLSLRSVSLSKLDFSEKAPRLKMPIATDTEYVKDMTGDFMQKTESSSNAK